MIPAMQRGDPQWSELRAVGAGWWIRNINTLRKMVEKVPRYTHSKKTCYQWENVPLKTPMICCFKS